MNEDKMSDLKVAMAQFTTYCNERLEKLDCAQRAHGDTLRAVISYLGGASNKDLMHQLREQLQREGTANETSRQHIELHGLDAPVHAIAAAEFRASIDERDRRYKEAVFAVLPPGVAVKVFPASS